MKNKVRLQYCLLHFLYWSALGCLGSFCSVFLLPKGYSSAEIGMILSMGSVLAMVIEPFFANEADSGRRYTLPQLVGFLAVVTMALAASLFLFPHRSIALSVLYVLAYGFIMSMNPLIAQINFIFEKNGIHLNFGFARGIGSAGYSICVAVLGVLTETYNVSITLVTALILLSCVLVILFLLNRVKVDDTVERKQQETISNKEFIQNHKDLFFLDLGGFMCMINSFIYDTYMLQVITPVGGTSRQMGYMLSITALCEVPGMILADRLLKKKGSRFVLSITALAFFLKGLIFLLAPSTTYMIPGCMLQMLSFAFLMPAMVSHTHAVLNEKEAARGQAIWAMASSAAGLMTSLGGGIILDAFGAHFLITIGMCTSLAGFVIIRAATRKQAE